MCLGTKGCEICCRLHRRVAESGNIERCCWAEAGRSEASCVDVVQTHTNHAGHLSDSAPTDCLSPIGTFLISGNCI